MYNEPAIGLDVDLNRLRSLVQLPNFDTIIDALRSTRIARVGGVRSRNFSFVHRRFAEFFVVRAIMAGVHEVPIDAIPEDSRWRDCMVVYCGVAPEEKIQPIADFCWNVIKRHSAGLDGMDTHKARPAIHSLRFLRDAFLGRAALLTGFQEELSQYILRWIAGTDLIVAKIAAEALGLLSPKNRSEGIAQAFKRDSLWIKETALQACRHLRGLEDEAKRAIRRYMRTLPVPKLFSSYRDLSFGFSLSEDLRFQRWGLRLDVAWILILWAIILSMMMFSKLMFSLLVLLILWAVSIEVLTAFYPSKMPYLLRPVYRPLFDSSLRLLLLYMLLAVVGMPMIAYVIHAFFPETDWFKDLRNVSENLPIGSFLRDCASLVCMLKIAAILSLPILLIAPWELWLNLPTILGHSFKHLVRPPALYVFLTSVVVFGVTNYFKDTLEKLAWGFLIVVGVGLIVILWFFIRDVWQWNSDRMRLRRLVIPDQVDRPCVYQICRSLKTSAWRQHFLELLRLRKVEVTDEPGARLVNESWIDDRVQESLARLKSIWQGCILFGSVNPAIQAAFGCICSLMRL